MQHEFNMKLAETIEKEHERKTPVYAEVRGEKGGAVVNFCATKW